MSVLAVCPSRGRPEAAAAALASLEATRADPATRLVFIVDRDDPTRGKYPAGAVIVPPTGSMGGALVAGTTPATLGPATVVGFIGDDNRFATPGWDTAIAAALELRPGIAYADDGFQHEKLPTSWWISRPIVDVLGLTLPALRQFWMDNFWLELGRATDALTYLPDVLIEHLHPLAGKAADDPTYARGRRVGIRDRTIFERWKARELAGDVARFRAAIAPRTHRRILADWHHPALWESLALLFEDRLGFELYAMAGREWIRHGWRFSAGTPGWTAAQYLDDRAGRPVGDHLEIPVPEYPSRPRKAVTWAQAKTLRPDFVLASVAIHQAPFAQLARELGAGFITQIGNARHPIEAGPGAIVLASAATEHPGAITYHQEFSRPPFDYRPPVPHDGPPRVRAFMLRLGTTSGPYAWLAEHVDWQSYGGSQPGATGYLAPMTAVADAMAGADFVWHDKTIGDGYGHVLHNAAAMGRPLIGHASHYAGQLGAPLWRDLETCIDLDRHPPARALALIRAIVADPDWHRAMTDATADTFAHVVDFAAEAETIRAALAER